MERNVKTTPLLLLAFFCLLPAIQTAVSVHLQWHTEITYPTFKLLMIGGPIVVWLASGYTVGQIGPLLGLKKTNTRPGISTANY